MSHKTHDFGDFEEADIAADECVSGDEGEYDFPRLDSDDLTPEDVEGLRQLDEHLRECYGRGSRLFASLNNKNPVLDFPPDAELVPMPSKRPKTHDDSPHFP